MSKRIENRSNDRIIATGLTDCGKIHDHNEDAFSISEYPHLFIVSDGMGEGQVAGKVISGIVTRELPMQVSVAFSTFHNYKEYGVTSVLKHTIMDLSDKVYARAVEVDYLRGAGATIVACLVHGNVAVIANMGDSRSYLIRGARLEQLTRDHTIGGMLLRLGMIPREEAEQHSGSRILTRHVGMEANSGPDIGLLDLKKGDRLLLCTDGLTSMVPDPDIGEILWSESDIEIACTKLVNAANEAGGKDNITVLIVQYNGFEQSERRKKKVLVRQEIGKSLRKEEAQAESTYSQQGVGTRSHRSLSGFRTNTQKH